MFQPIIASSGIAGWSFLQRTYDRQFESFSNTPQIRNDRAYLEEKLASPLSQDEFLGDRRLLRIAMTAFGLAGEEWKKGFIAKALNEAADPDSTFLARLSNRAYSEFARAFRPSNGMIDVSRDSTASIARDFERAAFEAAVGEVDTTMRLSLNYQSSIADVARAGSSDETILYRILGDVPVRTVLGQALNIPESVQRLPLEQQAGLFAERLRGLGITSPQDLSAPQQIDKVLRRYHAMESINQSASLGTSSASIALVLLGGASGFGSSASENLFRSGFL